jgi:proline dehydrogenase
VLGRSFLWVSEKPRVEKLITEGSLTRNLVDRFVAGNTLEDAVGAIKELNSRGIGGILDHLGEGVADARGAQDAANDYLAAVKRIEETRLDTTVSIKLTQLGLAFDKQRCIEHVHALASEAQAAGARMEIDIEQSQYVTDTLEVYRTLQADFPDLRVALQAYMRRTPVDLETMASLRPRIRLVKGAYAEPRAVAFQKKSEIDAQYAFLIDWLFEKGTDPAIASHDGKLLAHAKQTAASAGDGKTNFEIQMLYGVRRDLQEQLASEGYRVRTYVPYGSAWYPYLTRRIAERPSNLLFSLRAFVGK